MQRTITSNADALAAARDPRAATYDRAYLDSFAASYVLDVLGFELRDAQDAMRTDNLDAFAASEVLIRLATHILLSLRR